MFLYITPYVLFYGIKFASLLHRQLTNDFSLPALSIDNKIIETMSIDNKNPIVPVVNWYGLQFLLSIDKTVNWQVVYHFVGRRLTTFSIHFPCQLTWFVFSVVNWQGCQSTTYLWSCGLSIDNIVSIVNWQTNGVNWRYVNLVGFVVNWHYH